MKISQWVLDLYESDEDVDDDEASLAFEEIYGRAPTSDEMPWDHVCAALETWMRAVAGRSDDPTEAEIARSQARIAEVLGPDEIAKLDRENARFRR